MDVSSSFSFVEMRKDACQLKFDDSGRRVCERVGRCEYRQVRASKQMEAMETTCGHYACECRRDDVCAHAHVCGDAPFCHESMSVQRMFREVALRE